MKLERPDRRIFITLLGGALAWPRGARAQGQPVPVVGFLNSAFPEPFARLAQAFLQGLNDGGYSVGRNVAIEYRWAEGQYARLPELATDLVRRRVSVIAATGGSQTARAARGVTSTVPILFIGGPDPIGEGLVTNLGRPEGNLTGVAVYTSDLMPKRLQMLTQLVPRAKTVALLVNPTGFAADNEARLTEAAMQTTGQRLVVLKAATEVEFEPAFASAVEQRVDAILVHADPFFNARRAQLVALAARYAIPTGYPWREYAEAGGLMSYGSSIPDAYRQVGRYAGEILKGKKPGELPVHMPTRFDLVINLTTAKSLGLTVPPMLSALANELLD
ncbi:MAG TPA: ABC transporter substrate-binding protein [Xanthobacteraceae bacterium]|nr:ABC transporter substrate-binding protein [Xanthobacteraceae bacterium]